MKISKKAFTLLELLISIVILSIMIVYLYKSYSTLNLSNLNLKKETKAIENMEVIKKVLYMDFLNALGNKNSFIKIESRDKDEDFVRLQTNQSLHRRINPYVTYIVQEKKLYRLESYKPIANFDMSIDDEFISDYIGDIENFNVYKSSEKENNLYLIHIKFTSMKEILFMVKALNI